MRLYCISPTGKHIFWRAFGNIEEAIAFVIRKYPEQSYAQRDEDGQWHNNVNLTITGTNTFTLDFTIMVDNNEEDVMQYNFIVI